MNREQVKKLFKFISHVYATFEVSSDKLDTWTRLLNNQDPAKVMKKAERHALENKFPPTIANLTERKTAAQSNDIFKKMERWERDAVGKPPRS